MHKNNLLNLIQISNYWDDLWSEEDEEEEAPALLNSSDASDDEEDKEQSGAEKNFGDAVRRREDLEVRHAAC